MNKINIHKKRHLRRARQIESYKESLRVAMMIFGFILIFAAASTGDFQEATRVIEYTDLQLLLMALSGATLIILGYSSLTKQ